MQNEPPKLHFFRHLLDDMDPTIDRGKIRIDAYTDYLQQKHQYFLQQIMKYCALCYGPIDPLELMGGKSGHIYTQDNISVVCCPTCMVTYFEKERQEKVKIILENKKKQWEDIQDQLIFGLFNPKSKKDTCI